MSGGEPFDVFSLISDDLLMDNLKLRALVIAMHGSLIEYSRHKPLCNLLQDHDCDCGYEKSE